jgi:hypothetical protein
LIVKFSKKATRRLPNSGKHRVRACIYHAGDNQMKTTLLRALGLGLEFVITIWLLDMVFKPKLESRVNDL